MPPDGTLAHDSSNEWSVETLKKRLDSTGALFLLDVRNREEFAAGKVEGRVAHPALNVPYFEILEGGGTDDRIESVKIYAGRKFSKTLPRDQPVVTICAKGGTSAIVAEGLRAMGYRAVNVAGGPGEADRHGVFGAKLGDLRERNEGLRRAAGASKEFQDWILASLPVFPPQYVDIKRANLGLIAPDEEESEELELGKNVCALEAHTLK